MAPLLPQLAAAITRSLSAMLAAAAAGQQRIADLIAASSLPAAQRSREQQQNKGLTADLAAEGTAAAVLLTLLVQLAEQAAAAAAAAGGQPAAAELPAELEPAAKAAAAVAAVDFGGGVVRLPSAGVGLVEACLEVSDGSFAEYAWSQHCFCAAALPLRAAYSLLVCQHDFLHGCTGCRPGGEAHRFLRPPDPAPRWWADCCTASRPCCPRCWTAIRTTKTGATGTCFYTCCPAQTLNLLVVPFSLLPLLALTTCRIVSRDLPPPPPPHPPTPPRHRLLDRWVILGGARDIAEMFVPAMGALGR